MKTYNISSLEELKKTFDELIDKDAIFRGVNKQNQIFPKLFRDTNYSNKEYYILKAFEQYYGLYTTANNCWEFVALAQHCGLMTRLIDFSTNPYVALFFSLYHDGDSYIIYSLDKSHYETIYGSIAPGVDQIIKETHIIDLSLFQETGESFADSIEKEFRKLSSKKGIYVIRPNYRNQRMLMQQGLFVVPTKASKESIKTSLLDKADQIIIDKSMRLDALKYLLKLGYDEFHLMPDLDSVCNEINNRVENILK